MQVAIIGGGPAGMMTAIEASKNNNVTLYEKNEKLGKKLYITGKGRCNVTNNCTETDFFDNVVSNPKFLFSSIYSFNCQSTMNFFEQNNCPLKTERGNRVFPLSDKSSDIIKTMENCLKNNNVKVKFNSNVEAVYKQDDKIVVKVNGEKIVYDKVAVCTGGMSYKTTGSDGSGYKFAKCFGHSIVDVKSALCPIKLKKSYKMGLSLKNVELICKIDGKIRKTLFGEMLFTNDGISGPICISMSSFINKYENSNIELFINFKSAISTETLKNRLQNDILNNKNITIQNLLKEYLPKNFILDFLEVCKISPQLKCNSITQENRLNLITNMQFFPLQYDRLYDINYGIITSGGISVNEINPNTMESKLMNNLYFAGEVIDVDALTGGFNIQIALATGYLAGRSI